MLETQRNVWENTQWKKLFISDRGKAEMHTWKGVWTSRARSTASQKIGRDNTPGEEGYGRPL